MRQHASLHLHDSEDGSPSTHQHQHRMKYFPSGELATPRTASEQCRIRHLAPRGRRHRLFALAVVSATAGTLAAQSVAGATGLAASVHTARASLESPRLAVSHRPGAANLASRPRLRAGGWHDEFARAARHTATSRATGRLARTSSQPSAPPSWTDAALHLSLSELTAPAPPAVHRHVAATVAERPHVHVGSPPPAPAAAPSDGVSPTTWAALRECESSDDYSADTGNGFYGAYQFTISSWYAVGFSGLPSDAPPAEQDLAAQRLLALQGWGAWPVCSVRIGM
jgi:hypothetical protein